MNVQSIIGDEGHRRRHDRHRLRRCTTPFAALGERRIGALVVSRRRQASIEGIISERDIVRAASQRGAGALDTTASDRSCRPMSSRARSATVSTV